MKSKIMKQLLIFAVSVLFFSVAKAQGSKVSKEETIAFLDRTVKEAIGSKGRGGLGTITAASFQFHEINYSFSMYFDGESLVDVHQTYSNIRWDTYTSMELEDSYGKYSSYYLVIFTAALNQKEEKRSYGEPYKTQNKQLLGFSVFTPPNKAESVKKAILRLVEIAKEENKDPFAD